MKKPTKYKHKLGNMSDIKLGGGCKIRYVKHITLKRIKISTNVVSHYHHWQEIRDREQMFPQPTLIYRCISYVCSNKTQRQVLKLHKILIKTLSVTKYYAFNYNLYSAFNAYNPTLCNPTFRMNKSFLSLNVMWYCVCVCESRSGSGWVWEGWGAAYLQSKHSLEDANQEPLASLRTGSHC